MDCCPLDQKSSKSKKAKSKLINFTLNCCLVCVSVCPCVCLFVCFSDTNSTRTLNERQGWGQMSGEYHWKSHRHKQNETVRHADGKSSPEHDWPNVFVNVNNQHFFKWPSNWLECFFSKKKKKLSFIDQSIFEHLQQEKERSLKWLLSLSNQLSRQTPTNNATMQHSLVFQNEPVFAQ